MADKLFWLGKGVLRYSDRTFVKKGEEINPNRINKNVLKRLLATKQIGTMKDRIVEAEAEKASKKVSKKEKVTDGSTKG